MLSVLGEGEVSEKYGYSTEFRDRPIPAGFEERLARYDIVQALDFYDFAADACRVHPNVFIYLDENIPFSIVYASGVPAENKQVILERARHFLCVSESVRSALVTEGISEGRISVIPFWAVVSYPFRRKAGEVVEGYKKHLSSKFKVLYVGRYVEEKGVKILVQAISPVKNEVSLAVVGEGPFRWPFWVNDLKKRESWQLEILYSLADVVVLPAISTAYWMEQFGRVLIEAMACGVPQVATDLGGPRDIVEHGKTGFLIPPNSPDALRGVVLRLMEDERLRLEMSKNSLARFERLFAKGVVDEQIQHCYEENFELS